VEKAAFLKISIITVCHNSEQYLSETIDSVARQTYPHIEYIVIDGNSTDNTIEIIKENERHIFKWLSEPDSCMYDAINKGLKLATGDYILVLNSDDKLASENIIEKAVIEIKKQRLDYYYGNMYKSLDGKLKKVRLFQVSFKELLLSTHGTFASHPTFFISASLNKALDNYDLKYKYASDYDYILRALATKGKKGKHLNLYISKFRIHENSITSSGKIESERQKILIQHRYHQYPIIIRWIYYYSLWIYYKLINLGHRFQAG
jgi:glycosyltransferase involved in cell wall biosynthesis